MNRIDGRGVMLYQSKADLVATEVRELIRAGEFRPGDALKQRDIAERLGVSPTPVREALRRLEAEGWVSSEHHRAATVVRSESSRLYENALIRAALEGLGARLAAERVTAEDLDEIRVLQQRCATAEDADLIDRNRQFHFRIYEAGDSPVLLAQLRLLWRMLSGGPHVDRSREASNDQHLDLVAALEQGDGRLAEELTRHHILEAADPPTDTRSA